MTRLTFANIRPTRVFDSSGYGLYYTAGNVGIGTNNPTATLEVSGNLIVDRNVFVVDGTNNRVGIGKSNPTSVLDVSGTVNINNNTMTFLSTNQTYIFELIMASTDIVRALKFDSTSSTLYVGGSFSSLRVNRYLASDNTFLDSTVYSPSNIFSISFTTGAVSILGTGLNGQCYAIDISGTNVYVGGAFSLAGGVTDTKRIARWNGSTWNAMGGGLQSDCNAIKAIGSNVYVGGTFTSAYSVGTTSVTNTAYIARWDGSAWNAMSTGLNNPCNAIDASGSNVYVGGIFTLAGGVASTVRIALWNGSAWSAMGGGLQSDCNAIAISGSNIYVGGAFTSAYSVGTTTVSNTSKVALWNGSAWSALSTGLVAAGARACYSIVISGSNVYFGGDFTQAGAVSNTSGIARWDGSAWNAMGTGLDGNIGYTMTLNGSNLYVGGTLTGAGGVTNTAKLAEWDGTSWSTVSANSVSYSTQRVAFGKASPTVELDISGNTTIKGNLNVDNNTLFVDGTYNRIGVGKSNPAYAMDISGYIKTNAVGFHVVSSISSTSPSPARYSGTYLTGASGQYDTIIHNIGNAWNSTNGLFTAPVSGYYYFSANAFTGYGGVTSRMEFRKVSGGSTTAYGGGFFGGSSVSYNSVAYVTANAFIQLSAGDTVGVYAISNISFGGWAADTGGFSSPANYFNGYLISAL